MSRARSLGAFFLAATLFAAGAVLLWTAGYIGWLPSGPGVLWHAHEMVFGYGLAVVAGYLLTRAPTWAIGVCLGAWLAARAIQIPGSPPMLAAAVSLAFPACLGVFAGIPLLRATKSWRNAIFGVPLLGFAVAELLYQLGLLGVLPEGEARGLILGIDLLALLLFTMGGRVIAAASSGALQRRGVHLHGVAHPRLERIGVAALLTMAALDTGQTLPPLAAAAAATAGVTVILRLVRWRFWQVGGALDVACLHLGYAWLAIGLVLKAAAQGFAALPLADALHGLTVGALGTLTAVMMVRVTLQRLRRPITFSPAMTGAIALISLAAILRLVGAAAPWPVIAAAGACWSLGFLALSVLLLALMGGPPRPMTAGARPHRGSGPAP